jgi:hypothetical protein
MHEKERLSTCWSIVVCLTCNNDNFCFYHSSMC